MTTFPSLPAFGQGLNGAKPGVWADTADVDGDRPPWSRAPLGYIYWKRVTANQQEQYIKVKDDGRNDDWVLVQGIISERVTFGDFTDGGSTAGTYDLNGTIPAGAYFEKTLYTNVTAFSGDTTATLITGDGDDGTDDDRYNTGTPSIFATDTSVDAGAPSGTRYHDAAVTPRLTATSTSDWGAVATTGAVTVTLFYYGAAL